MNNKKMDDQQQNMGKWNELSEDITETKVSEKMYDTNNPFNKKKFSNKANTLIGAGAIATSMFMGGIIGYSIGNAVGKNSVENIKEKAPIEQVVKKKTKPMPKDDGVPTAFEVPENKVSEKKLNLDEILNKPWVDNKTNIDGWKEKPQDGYIKSVEVNGENPHLLTINYNKVPEGDIVTRILFDQNNSLKDGQFNTKEGMADESVFVAIKNNKSVVEVDNYDFKNPKNSLGYQVALTEVNEFEVEDGILKMDLKYHDFKTFMKGKPSKEVKKPVKVDVEEAQEEEVVKRAEKRDDFGWDKEEISKTEKPTGGVIEVPAEEKEVEPIIKDGCVEGLYPTGGPLEIGETDGSSIMDGSYVISGSTAENMPEVIDGSTLSDIMEEDIVDWDNVTEVIDGDTIEETPVGEQPILDDLFNGKREIKREIKEDIPEFSLSITRMDGIEPEHFPVEGKENDVHRIYGLRSFVYNIDSLETKYVEKLMRFRDGSTKTKRVKSENFVLIPCDKDLEIIEFTELDAADPDKLIISTNNLIPLNIFRNGKELSERKTRKVLKEGYMKVDEGDDIKAELTDNFKRMHDNYDIEDPVEKDGNIYIKYWGHSEKEEGVIEFRVEGRKESETKTEEKESSMESRRFGIGLNGFYNERSSNVKSEFVDDSYDGNQRAGRLEAMLEVADDQFVGIELGYKEGNMRSDDLSVNDKTTMYGFNFNGNIVNDTDLYGAYLRTEKENTIEIDGFDIEFEENMKIDNYMVDIKSHSLFDIQKGRAGFYAGGAYSNFNLEQDNLDESFSEYYVYVGPMVSFDNGLDLGIGISQMEKYLTESDKKIMGNNIGFLGTYETQNKKNRFDIYGEYPVGGDFENTKVILRYNIGLEDSLYFTIEGGYDKEIYSDVSEIENENTYIGAGVSYGLKPTPLQTRLHINTQ